MDQYFNTVTLLPTILKQTFKIASHNTPFLTVQIHVYTDMHRSISSVRVTSRLGFSRFVSCPLLHFFPLSVTFPIFFFFFFCLGFVTQKTLEASDLCPATARQLTWESDRDARSVHVANSSVIVQTRQLEE